MNSDIDKFSPITIHEALIMLVAVGSESRFTFKQIQQTIQDNAPDIDTRNKNLKQALTDLNFTRRRLTNELGNRVYYWIKPTDSLEIFQRQSTGLEPQDREYDYQAYADELGVPNLPKAFGFADDTIDYCPFILDFQITLLREIPGKERKYLLMTMRELRGEYPEKEQLYKREPFIKFLKAMRPLNRQRFNEELFIFNLRDAGIPVDREPFEYRNANKYNQQAYPKVYALVTAISKLICSYARRNGILADIALSELKEILNEVRFEKLDNEILVAILRAMGFNNQRINIDGKRQSYWICEPQNFITSYPIEIMRTLYDKKLLDKAQKSIKYTGDTWNFMPGY